MAVKHEETLTQGPSGGGRNAWLGFGWVNLGVLALSVATIVAGYVLLDRGSVTAAPLLLILGYVILFPAAILLGYRRLRRND